MGLGCGFLISGMGGGLTFCLKESCIAFARLVSGFRSTSGFLLSLIFYAPNLTCCNVLVYIWTSAYLTCCNALVYIGLL